jgi:hypothetical protein
MRTKGTYLLIIMLLACSAGMAQMTMSFRITPIVSSNSGMTSSGSTPIIMEGSSKCVIMASGLSSMAIANNGKGEFGAACKEVAPVANIRAVSISLNVYPNPTSGMTTLKCEGEFDANLSCQVRVMSIEGKMMMSQMVPMNDVKAGYMINASAYAAGTYVIIMDFMNQQYNKKFIKL